MDYEKAWKNLFNDLLDDKRKDYPLIMSCFSNSDKLEEERGRRKERDSIIENMKSYPFLNSK